MIEHSPYDRESDDMAVVRLNQAFRKDYIYLVDNNSAEYDMMRSLERRGYVDWCKTYIFESEFCLSKLGMARLELDKL